MFVRKKEFELLKERVNELAKLLSERTTIEYLEYTSGSTYFTNYITIPYLIKLILKKLNLSLEYHHPSNDPQWELVSKEGKGEAGDV